MKTEGNRTTPFRLGIWARLLLAFSFISGITLIVGMMALLIFYNSEDVVEQLAEDYIPELVQTSDFVKLGSEIIAVAPNILSAEDQQSRRLVKKDLDRLLVKLNKKLDILTVARPELRTTLGNLIIRLEANLTALQTAITSQNELQTELNLMTEQLRWYYADLIGEVDPLKQDYAYNLEIELERIIDAAKEHQEISAAELQRHRIAKDAVEKIRSNGVLLVSLMVQGASLNNSSQLDNLSALSSDAVALLKQDMKYLQNEISFLTLKNVLEELVYLAEGKNSVFAIRHKIIHNDEKGRAILKQNHLYVEELDNVIAQIIDQAAIMAQEATTSSKTKLKRAKNTMISMVLISLLTTAAVMWFYVRGNIVVRLSKLSKSMRAIAKGDLSHEVPKGSADEIGRMASALEVFRDTAQAVEDANAQAIIDNAAVGLILADPDGTIRFFNPQAEELFGVDSDTMVGTSLYNIVSVTSKTTFIDGCSQVLKGQKDTTYSGVTYLASRFDGREFPVDAFIRKVQQRKTIRLMVTLHDVTEREQAQELLRKRVREKTEHLSEINIKLREEVQERLRVENELVQAGKLAALGEFSAGIAHELNQPLSAIRYYLHNADKLIERGKTETHQENLQKMEELIKRMAKMINHLKTFARLHSENLVSVDLKACIDGALELLKDRLEKDNIKVTANFQTSSHVYADASRLEQVFINTLSNGIDAARTNKNGGELEITVKSEDDHIHILIKDNGDGISKEPIESVFDPFYTTKEVGKGLGLGLSIAYNIITGFGGRMTVANNEGSSGACFTIILQNSEKFE